MLIPEPVAEQQLLPLGLPSQVQLALLIRAQGALKLELAHAAEGAGQAEQRAAIVHGPVHLSHPGQQGGAGKMADKPGQVRLQPQAQHQGAVQPALLEQGG
ncbi:hypothetical protein D3C80_1342920 [compost metagenome]